MGSISISSGGRPGAELDEAPTSDSRSILKLVVTEVADEGAEKSSAVVELGAAKTVFTNWVGVVVALVLVEGTLGGTARLSLCLVGYEACLFVGRGGCDEDGVVEVEGDKRWVSDKGEGIFYLGTEHGNMEISWIVVLLKYVTKRATKLPM